MKHLLAVSMILAAALPALAAGGKIPIYQVPVTIDQPGSYYLSRDITHNGAGSAIVIQASDVTIDFAGHTLDQGGGGIYAINLDGNYTNITIRNGKLKSGNIGIRLRNLTGDDFAVRIEEMTITGALNQGIYIEGQSLVGSSQAFIERNLIHDNGDDGISLRFMWGGRVADNVIQGSGTGSSDHGIYLHSCRGVTVTRNTISHSGADGIRIWYSWYCTIDWNHATYNNAWGVNIFDGDQIVFSNNRMYGNGSGGMTVPGGEGHVNAGGNYPVP